LEAADHGIDALQCASGATGDGISNPPSERIVANLRALGHRVDIDDEALKAVSSHFSAIARSEGLPVGQPHGFDASYLTHQLPGGMVGTMRRQLAEARMAHLEPAVIEELGRVRADLGWPIVMTPFAQIVMTQAVLNVTGSTRYATVPDEVIRYAIGRFGRPTLPIDPEVMARIEALPRTAELRDEPPMASIDEMRHRLGARLSDEEFLLRATMPAGQVDAMKAAGPARRDYNPGSRPVMRLIEELTKRHDLHDVRVERPDMRLRLRRIPQRASS
jgi:oxaloacetate decarboxylase alpha subunit